MVKKAFESIHLHSKSDTLPMCQHLMGRCNINVRQYGLKLIYVCMLILYTHHTGKGNNGKKMRAVVTVIPSGCIDIVILSCSRWHFAPITSFHAHDPPVRWALLIPILQMGKLKIVAVKKPAKVT